MNTTWLKRTSGRNRSRWRQQSNAPLRLSVIELEGRIVPARVMPGAITEHAAMASRHLIGPVLQASTPTALTAAHTSAASIPTAIPAASARDSVADEIVDDGSGSNTTTIQYFTGTNMTASADLWWFGGATPSNYATDILLTVTPNNYKSYEWTITQGSDKAQFPGYGSVAYSPDPYMDLESLAGSAALNDVRIEVRGTNDTTLGWTSGVAAALISICTPKRLQPNTDLAPNGIRDDILNDEFGGRGYTSHLFYKILNQFGDVLPMRVEVNEKFPSGVTFRYNNSNWPQRPQNAKVAPDKLEDKIQACTGDSFTPESTNPQNPLSQTKVDYSKQEIRIGSLVTGEGVLVQKDDLVRYVDHGRHENIVSPVP